VVHFNDRKHTERKPFLHLESWYSIPGSESNRQDALAGGALGVKCFF
jgi:hypothetical protein